MSHMCVVNSVPPSCLLLHFSPLARQDILTPPELLRTDPDLKNKFLFWGSRLRRLGSPTCIQYLLAQEVTKAMCWMLVHTAARLSRPPQPISTSFTTSSFLYFYFCFLRTCSPFQTFIPTHSGLFSCYLGEQQNIEPVLGQGREKLRWRTGAARPTWSTCFLSVQGGTEGAVLLVGVCRTG